MEGLRAEGVRKSEHAEKERARLAGELEASLQAAQQARDKSIRLEE